MKKVSATIMFLAFYYVVSAQINFANSSEIKTFLKSKTLVVLDEDPFSSFNETLKAVMTKLWTITPYDYITMEEFDKKKSSNSYSFIMLSEAEQKEDGVLCRF
ncbi:MAG: hypothetical protein HGB12_12110, partial [Bacteroidetes bacterium]|nr:hypothetical protein [Bacteroidota bacterium]